MDSYIYNNGLIIDRNNVLLTTCHCCIVLESLTAVNSVFRQLPNLHLTNVKCTLDICHVRQQILVYILSEKRFFLLDPDLLIGDQLRGRLYLQIRSKRNLTCCCLTTTFLLRFVVFLMLALHFNKLQFLQRKKTSITCETFFIK